MLLDHGFPLRLIVPGFVGVRNCKWIRKIIISDEEAKSPQQKENYKYITESDPSKIDYSKIPPVMTYVINSAICQPLDQDVITVTKENPYISLKGWATGNMKEGSPVEKVLITFDNGANWEEATITKKEDKRPDKEKVFTWVLWEYKLDCTKLTDTKVKAIVRCVDSLGATQDKPVEEQYNLRGLLNNSPHSIKFTVRLNPENES